MAHDFDQRYWDEHWREAHADPERQLGVATNPHLIREVGPLPPGTALEAGCGEGAEAIWLAGSGWSVTAVDIAAEALARAEARAQQKGVGDRVAWVSADLTSWEPTARFDLVTTHYAHPTMPQLAFYDRLATWVAPGGSLLVVGHAGGHEHDHGHHHGTPPAEATVTVATITERFDPLTWDVVTAQKYVRPLEDGAGTRVTLQDVVVRAVRRTA